MAFKSPSLKSFMLNHGIGGKTSRPLDSPWCLPVLAIWINVASVHSPMPVSLSGVKFMAKLTPQGPAKAVPVPFAVISTFRLASSGVQAGCGAFCGWPESKRFASGSGAPPGPGIFGVWQSLHAPRVIKYLPRSTEDSFSGAFRSHPNTGISRIAETMIPNCFIMHSLLRVLSSPRYQGSCLPVPISFPFRSYLCVARYVIRSSAARLVRGRSLVSYLFVSIHWVEKPTRRWSRPPAPIRDLTTGRVRLRKIRSSCGFAGESFFSERARPAFQIT